MTEPGPLEEAVRWLASNKDSRERQLLEILIKGEFAPKELKDYLDIDHDKQLFRTIDALEDYGLLNRYYNPEHTRRGNVYTASPMGQRALKLLLEVDRVLQKEA